MNKKSNYGIELVLDLHGCDSSLFTRDSLDEYFKKLCTAIDMQQCERYFWDDVGVLEDEKQNLPHTKGTSAVQFILTSSVVIHTLDMLDTVYINIFSCKSFDSEIAKKISTDWFKATDCDSTLIERKLKC